MSRATICQPDLNLDRGSLCLDDVVGDPSPETRLFRPEPNPGEDVDANVQNGPANPKNDILETSDHDVKDFWQMAHDELTESDRNTLAALLPSTAIKPQDADGARTKEILDGIVKATEAQYREKGEKNGFRVTAHKILNSALSFQDVISNTVKFDPTGYASSAWAIVSLGLTMAKNHADLQGALFDSSGYLADLLTRCAFIEEQFYEGEDLVIVNVEKQRSIVRVYVAILRYSAEVRRVQQFNKGKNIVESITAITSQPLTQLKTSIKEEESYLHHWLVLDQYLRRKQDAEEILTRLDEVIVDIQKMRNAVDMLNLPFAKGAFFDSFEDQYENECLPGTRTELLQQVQDWGKSNKRPSDKHIFWLSGMAGTGKSTIARTVARSFKEDGILGASFFFKRGEGDRGSAAKFFSTIVKQLAVYIPQMIVGIRKAIEDDPSIPGSSLREQFNKLMLQPLLAVYHGKAMNSTVVVIDALDECEREEDVEIILDLLPKVETATKMAIRFFLTSRPESPIRFGFNQIDKSGYQNTILQNLDENVIKRDITLYLREKFITISQKRQNGLPSGWPGEKRIEALAMMACPLFIFAATDATDRNKLIEKFQRIVGVIIFLANPLSLSSLAELLEIPDRYINIYLDLFYSVLSIPSDSKLPIRTLHLSFHDYLVDDLTKDQEAMSRFWVDKKEKHELIACQCLAVMGRYLRKNICDLPNHGTSRTEIDPDAMARFLPPALQYACRYWVYHLLQSSAPAKSLDQVFPFLKEHFLHWLESMSILGMIPEAIIAVNSLLQLTKDIPSNEIYVFLGDARRFILKFVQILDTAPLQLYSAGLIFAPHKALIRENFKKELPAWLYKGPKVEEYWNPEMQTLEGHSDWVRSVAFSGDSQLLASGSYDNTIKLWDPATGTLKYTLEGHSSSVKSVAFSGDSQLLVSGSYDKTVKLWDPVTGALKHTLEGHSSSVWSVAFSGDSQLLASGSYDNTVKL
ncbi:NACHT and WD repeat domain-containing protein [Aspergillus affinis]|uniref:NACHT and WD repeat domain-containing protein n=1 Tax=Aspergillus affinis TaxID=1070780 RepID=UPI0022FEE828|nr:uncharacterized protein KD926_007461 [Aspergillus affinis]KAI9041045.1 hypothetical protein KD926_007461 [Aspergillus affinis]